MAVVISSANEQHVLYMKMCGGYAVPMFLRAQNDTASSGGESDTVVFEMPEDGLSPQQSVGIAQAFVEQIPHATPEEAAWMVARVHAEATGISAQQQAEVAEGILARI